ncbi:hypothetical protein AFK68_08705, partial [Hydrocoleum sp. CS-953]
MSAQAPLAELCASKTELCDSKTPVQESGGKRGERKYMHEKVFLSRSYPDMILSVSLAKSRGGMIKYFILIKTKVFSYYKKINFVTPLISTIFLMLIRNTTLINVYIMSG